MTGNQAINLFLDENLVDELWTLLKRDGITEERLREVSGKVAAKATLGLGKLWKLLAPDIEAELSAEAGGTSTQKIQYTSFFRSLFLPELVDGIAKLAITDFDDIEKLNNGDFIELTCEKLELVPIPTFAGFMRQFVLENIEASDESMSFDSAISHLEKHFSSERAFTFANRMDDENFGSDLLEKFFDTSGEEMINALCMSNNDHVLALSGLLKDDLEIFVFSNLEERYLKRNLAIFSGKRPIVIFGRVAYLQQESSLTRKHRLLLGIQPVSINLE